MKKFKYLLAVMLLGCSTMSFAQFMNGGGSSSSSAGDVEAWKGLRFSYNHTFVNADVPGDYDPESGNGFSIAYEHAFKVAQKVPLFIQTGAGIDMYFSKWDENEDDWKDEYKQRMMSLTIPVNLVYGVKINDALAIKPYTGFYLRVNLFGKQKNEWGFENDPDGLTETDVNLFDDGEDDMDGNAYKRVQAGWQIGATLDVNNFNVGIGYALDFNKIAEAGVWSDRANDVVKKDVKLSNFFVRLGYNF